MTTTPKKKLTLTDALAEVTLLDKRIPQEIERATWDMISPETLVSDDLKAKRQQFIDDTKTGYQSIKALIENRHAIKAAILRANAGVPADTVLVNLVQVLGSEFTAAQLIERKKSLFLERTLVARFKKVNFEKERELAQANSNYEIKLEEYIKSAVTARGGKKDEATVLALTTEFSPVNQPKRIDPIGLVKEIERLEIYINEFESNIDRELSKFNAITVLDL